MAFLRGEDTFFSPRQCYFIKFCSFYILTISAIQKSFKKSKKYVARNGKSSTFAPAFGRNEGERREGIRKVKFFESLRPAQDQRRGSAAGIGTF